MPLTDSVLVRQGNQPLRITLTSEDECRVLEIVPIHTDAVIESKAQGARERRLHSAACIVLESDAALARSVRLGKTARLKVRRPHFRFPPHIHRADEVAVLRPHIEELIAPLLFDQISEPSLRPFQSLGVQWLLKHKKAILADDMGLGKTAQALRALQTLVAEGEVRGALIICPKSLMANWGSGD